MEEKTGVIKVMLSPGIIRVTTMGWKMPEGVPCYYRGQLIYPLRTTGHRVAESCGLESVEHMTNWMTEQIKAVRSQL